VLYSGAEQTLLDFAKAHNIPLVETQAGKGAVDWEEKLHFGSPGVTGTGCGNELAAKADLVIGVGTRFQDFTTGSWTVFSAPNRKLLSINIHGYDAHKRAAQPLVSDAKVALEKISAALGPHRFADPDFGARDKWFQTTDALFAAPKSNELPTDAQVIGAVDRNTGKHSVIMCAAGTMPGALHVLWRAAQGGYHMEYGFSCMGYEIAGAMGIKMALPESGRHLHDRRRQLHDGELRTRDRRDDGDPLHRRPDRQPGLWLHQPPATGHRRRAVQQPAGRQLSCERGQYRLRRPCPRMGANVVKAAGIGELEAAMQAAKTATIPTVIVIDTDPAPGTGAGGHVVGRGGARGLGPQEVNEARKGYEAGVKAQWLLN
jgi:3D-(3,5/4)-trihydroxycyclohexane-1,2-dione acylhydrolase (decyclizing)